MKKIVLAILLVLVLFIAVVYVFIPNSLTISSAASFHANRDGVYRFLSDENNWQKWWPGSISKTAGDSIQFRYEDCDLRIEEILYNAVELKVSKNSDTSLALFKLVPFTNDSIGIEISSEVNARPGPFSRLSAYFMARRLKQVFDGIVLSLSKYTGELKNIYGMNIKNEKVQYANLISTKQLFRRYPSTSDVYALIQKLRNYANKCGAHELFSPMLHIQKADSTSYTAQVGIPVDRALPEKDDITSKWMMKGGNILTGDVIGGQKQIEDAQRQMELYISDYQRSIIAIPFQMLITDRTKEPDSTKWITRLYYPVV